MLSFSEALELPVVCLEIFAEALEPLHLPSFPGSKFEGAFGQALFGLACARPEHHERAGCSGCPLRRACAYGELYSPLPPNGLPRGLRTPPRPLALATRYAQATDLRPGETFSFGLNLVGRATAYLPFVLAALRSLGSQGVGLTRGRFETVRVASVNPFSGEATTLATRASPLLSSQSLMIDRETLPRLPGGPIRITFQSMVQLKHRGEVLERPSFIALVRALQRRLSNLEQVYGDSQTKGLDYGALPAHAECVAVSGATWKRVSQARARNTHLSGVIGGFTLEGELEPFARLLRYGELVGVGKWASFGLGRYRVTPA